MGGGKAGLPWPALEHHLPPGQRPHPEAPGQGLRGQAGRQPGARPPLGPLRGNSNSLMTPTILRRQTSIKDLEDFASRAMAVNRAVEDEDEKVKLPGTRPPGKSETWSIKPSSSPSFSTLAPSSELLSKRRRSRVNFWDKMNKFCSIDELDLESDFFMKAIV